MIRYIDMRGDTYMNEPPTSSCCQFFNVNILQIKGFNKTCFCKHMDKIYKIGVLSIYWKTFSIHCSLRKTIIALRRVLISKMCILSIICQSAMILYIQCWALIFNLLESIVIVFLPLWNNLRYFAFTFDS